MIFILTLIFLFGLIIGSFLNVVIIRAKDNETISGRSVCRKCRNKIYWYDNVPLLSFILLGGRCRNCSEKISWQYPMVELATGLLFALAFYFNARSFGTTGLSAHDVLQLLRDWFIIAAMIVIFVIDLRWYLILDVISLPSAAVILFLNLFIGQTMQNICLPGNLWSCNPLSWSGLLISAIIGSGFFLFQFLVSRGRWVGGGDIRLGLLMGIALGWPWILVALMIAYFSGSIIGLGLMAIGKKQWSSMLPFGVFLAPATIITLYWGEAILNWYLNIFS